MDILSFKALHIIGFVAWFAGLFYLPRLFVYHIELLEEEKNSLVAKKFSEMEWRLFKIIMRPAMVITFVGGIGMLVANTDYLSQGWLHVKLVLVFLLAGYSDYMPRIIRKLQQGQIPMSSSRMRLFNEVPTLILVTIVLLAVFRGTLSWWKVLLVVLALILFILIASRLYRSYRKKQN